MAGTKGSIFKLVLLCFIVLSVFNCKHSTSKDKDSFTFIKRDTYSEENYSGVTVLRDNKTGELLDGYYVVGNEFSKWEEFNVNKGVLEGDYIIFHDNGEIFSHAQYLKGKLHGEKKINYKSGKLKTIKNFAFGKLTGVTKTFFETGQIQTESKIQDEEIIESVTYNLFGNIIAQSFDKEGRTISQRINNGKIIREHIDSNYDNFNAVKFYDEEGKVKMFLRMYQDEEDMYLIELDENENEIRRVNLKENPNQLFKYRSYLKQL